ncbi:hypothetical protein WN944_005243 [Citrus x changshan-huyou]|uniref:Uncharacterized protein n=1 Tax=Citrus x changshan-huyou TaxID=2935761 RepID=A0AAP0QMX9_9ROSI
MRDFTDLNEIKKPANQIKKQRTNTRQLWWLKQKCSYQDPSNLNEFRYCPEVVVFRSVVRRSQPAIHFREAKESMLAAILA